MDKVHDLPHRNILFAFILLISFLFNSRPANRVLQSRFLHKRTHNNQDTNQPPIRSCKNV